MKTMSTMSMTAQVLDVQACALLVCDCCDEREVLVHTPDACRFCPGDCVCIRYDGSMTRSVPPQITACGITKRFC